MTVTIVAEWTAAPGRCEDVLAILREVIAGTLAFDGCEDVRVLRDREDADRLLLVERWAAPERYAAYQQWRKETGTGGQIRDLLARPPQIRTLDDVEF